MLPLFTTHFSLRSILTTEQQGKTKAGSPDSIIDIAKEHELSDLYVCENTMSSFLDIYKNLKEIKCNLRFGLRMDVCPDLNEKTTESLAKTSRIVVWVLNQQGYYDLIKLHNLANTTGFYKDSTEKYSNGRIDYSNLRRLWTKNLALSIPFYDSYIFKNLLERGQCIPEFGDIQPTVFVENNELPFDSLVTQAIETAADKNWERVKVKSIYYKNREDFDAYLVYRAIQRRATFAKPNHSNMGSAEFCVESWQENS